jgi:hypothetical protein
VSSRPETPSPDHVVDLVADYVLGRLASDQASRVREHLRQCAGCAADYQWAAAFRAEAIHPTAERAVALAEGEPPTASEEDHLAQCADCRREIDVVGELELPAPMPRAVPAPRRRLRPRWQGWSLGALATAAVVLVLLQPWSGRVDLEAVRGLSQHRALPVQVPRSAPEATEFDSFRILGLEAYANAQWNEAIDALTTALALRDTDELRLYRGSARWLAGNDGGAEQDLAAVIRRDTTSPLAEAARWQLANLHLERGSTASALPLLRDVAENGRRFKGAADQLLRRLSDLGVDVE